MVILYDAKGGGGGGAGVSVIMTVNFFTDSLDVAPKVVTARVVTRLSQGCYKVVTARVVTD